MPEGRLRGVVFPRPTRLERDDLRQALQQAGLRVHRLSPKAAADYAESFDGVPSEHDGKDAAVVAELAHTGTTPEHWPTTSIPRRLGVKA